MFLFLAVSEIRNLHPVIASTRATCIRVYVRTPRGKTGGEAERLLAFGWHSAGEKMQNRRIDEYGWRQVQESASMGSKVRAMPGQRLKRQIQMAGIYYKRERDVIDAAATLIGGARPLFSLSTRSSNILVHHLAGKGLLPSSPTSYTYTHDAAFIRPPEIHRLTSVFRISASPAESRLQVMGQAGSKPIHFTTQMTDNQPKQSDARVTLEVAIAETPQVVSVATSEIRRAFC